MYPAALHSYNFFFIDKHASSHLLCNMLPPHCSTNTPSKLDFRAFVLQFPWPGSFPVPHMHGLLLPCVLQAFQGCFFEDNFCPPPTFQHSLFHFHCLIFLHWIVYHLMCIYVFGCCLSIHIACKLSEIRDLYCCSPRTQDDTGSVKIWWIPERNQSFWSNQMQKKLTEEEMGLWTGICTFVYNETHMGM